MSVLGFLWFLPTSQKHGGRDIGYDKFHYTDYWRWTNENASWTFVSIFCLFLNRRKSVCPNWGISSQSDKLYAPGDVRRPPTWTTAPLHFQSPTLTLNLSSLLPDTLFPPQTITLSLRPSPTLPAFTSQMARSAATTATPAACSFSTSEATKDQRMRQEEDLN